MSFSSSQIEQSIVSSESKVAFTSKNASGTFDSISGVIKFNENDLSSSSFDLKFNVASINTGEKLKDEHARGKKWFYAEKYPFILYKSKNVVKTEKGFLSIGELEIRGIKREMKVPFTFNDNTFSGEFDVDRIAFKVGSMRGMQKHVDKLIRINFAIVAK
jgi:polyisoprenoid-binding protein YceI